MQGENNESMETEFEPGKVFAGQFEILRALAEGAYGKVFEARQLKLDRVVALKVLPRNFFQDERSGKRFLAELAALSLLKHPGIVQAYSAGISDDGFPFVCSELIVGETLAQILKKKGSLEKEDCEKIFADLLDALAYAHDRNIVHRDLKPDNLIVSSSGEAKIIDFGLAKLIEPDGVNSQSLTKTGTIVGSPAYMSPEQARGSPVDARSDIYAIALVVYECLSGKKAFAAESAMQCMYMQINEDAPPLPLPTGSKLNEQALNLVLAVAMKKNPQERYQSAAQFKESLLQAFKTEAGHAAGASYFKDPKRISFVVLLLLFLGSAIVFLIFMPNLTKQYKAFHRRQAVSRRDGDLLSAKTKRLNHLSASIHDPYVLISQARTKRAAANDQASKNPSAAKSNYLEAIEIYDRCLSILKEEDHLLSYLASMGRFKCWQRIGYLKRIFGESEPWELKPEMEKSLQIALKSCRSDWDYERAQVLREFGVFEYDQEHFDKAIEHLLGSVRLKVKEPDYCPEASELVAKQNLLEEEDSTFAMEDLYCRLGLCYRAIGENELALKYFQKLEKRLFEGPMYSRMHNDNVMRLCQYLTFLHQTGRLKQEKELKDKLLNLIDKYADLAIKTADYGELAQQAIYCHEYDLALSLISKGKNCERELGMGKRSAGFDFDDLELQARRGIKGVKVDGQVPAPQTKPAPDPSAQK